MNFLSQLTGCFSTPADGNPTVAIVEAAYAHHKLNFRYINTEVQPKDLADAVAGARAMNWAGFHLSAPHKVEVIKHLDDLGESAKLMGAVNCAVLRDGKLIGENTDGKGFLESLQEVSDPAGKVVTILGAGGAARAIAIEVALAGANSVNIINRDAQRGKELSELVKKVCDSNYYPWDSSFAVPTETQILVNATTVGMHGNNDVSLDIDFDSLNSSMVVADVIINPPQTELLTRAAGIGCKTIDGLGMVVNQGVLAIKYWTGVDVDANVMREKLLEVL
ncbi:AroE Shikimate 5-dehydrogenase [Candidatus Nanopelagicaceae bacterium]